MGIFLFANTRVIVQGITGKEARFWVPQMLKVGTRIEAGVTPGREGEAVEGVPVYDTVRQAVAMHPADTSVIFVPAPYVMDAVFEAIDAGIRKIVSLADGVPLHDTLRIRSFARSVGAVVAGSNTAGVLTVGEAMLGFVPFWLTHVYRPGVVGLMTRSGSLTNEVASHVARVGHGFTTAFGVGGDPVPGTRFVEVLEMFQDDCHTKAVIMVGEVGGAMEEEVAEHIRKGLFSKPVVAFIAGRTAPPGKRMGHAGAIISMGKGSVASKEKALKEAGVLVASKPSEVGCLIQGLNLN